MNPQDLEILHNTCGLSKRPPEFAIRLLEETCQRTGLDWKARHVYLMVRASRDTDRWSVILSIDGFRMIGTQDPAYAGQDGPLWTDGPDGAWTDIPPDKAPYASKVGIRKKDGSVTWGVAKFADYRASQMWDKFPSTMTAKCAEMLAWRKTFPGRLGGLYGLEEMAQADKNADKILAGSGEKKAEVDAAPINVAESDWVVKLALAKSREELLDVGKQITLDKSLDIGSTIRLHQEFTRLKKQWE